MDEKIYSLQSHGMKRTICDGKYFLKNMLIFYLFFVFDNK